MLSKASQITTICTKEPITSNLSNKTTPQFHTEIQIAHAIPSMTTHPTAIPDQEYQQILHHQLPNQGRGVKEAACADILKTSNTVFGDALNEDIPYDFSFISFNTSIQQKKRQSSFSYKNSSEFKTSIQKFGSGVRLPELISVAQILSLLSRSIPEPNREEKRSFQGLIEWFHTNWEIIYPLLPLVHLRDEYNQIIDGRREFIEKCLKSK